MQPDSKLKIGRIGTEFEFEALRHASHFPDALNCKLDHGGGMVFPRIRESTDSDVAVAHNFDFEHTVLLCYSVKGTKVLERQAMMVSKRGLWLQCAGYPPPSSEVYTY